MGPGVVVPRALLVLFFTLPLHLLSTFLRLLHGSRGGRVGMPPLTVTIVSTSVVFLSILASTGKAPPPLIPERDVPSELVELKLKVAELESALEDNNGMLNSKAKKLKENELLIEEMEFSIQYLQNSLSAIKKSASCSSSSGKKISEMEEEIQYLSGESRKNNFDLYTLELETHDAEKKLKSLTAQVQRMESIVAEQWIQIRQVEQALQLTKIRASKATKGKESSKAFLEFVRDCYAYHLTNATDFLRFCFSKQNISIVRLYLSRAFHNYNKIPSLIQEYHHKLQYIVKRTLECNVFTAVLANNEFVFFLASAIIVFPITFGILLVTV